MNRRQFLTGLSGILAAQWAPAVVGSGVLMPVRKLWTPQWPVITTLWLPPIADKSDPLIQFGYAVATCTINHERHEANRHYGAEFIMFGGPELDKEVELKRVTTELKMRLLEKGFV